MRRLASALLMPLLAALALSGASSAVGPSLPALEGGSGIASTSGTVSYVTHLTDGGSSTLLEEKRQGRTVQTVRLSGGWGIQLATLDGALTGLSPNGRVLVLSDNTRGNLDLRPRSRFAVINTRALAITRTITLRGDFSLDALSPDGRLLYLIHHVSKSDATKYQVQAYNLATGRMLPGVVADKSQAGWIMAGYPVTRTSAPGGGWVYTLYRQDDTYPFIHALDTTNHTAICIGIPANWTTDATWISNARLKLAAGKLEIRTSTGTTRYLLNTSTFKISTP